MRRGIVTLSAVAAVVLPGCGGDDQSAAEPSGSFKVDVVRTSFPRLQHLAESQRFEIELRNAGDRTIPDLGMTLEGFSAAADSPGLADAQRPVWIVDRGPAGGDSAYVDTWALGQLAPGQTRTYVWSVSAIAPGQHRLKWRVSAGLTGKAQALTPSGDAPEGQLTVRVDRRPADATVDPATGRVVRKY